MTISERDLVSAVTEQGYAMVEDAIAAAQCDAVLSALARPAQVQPRRSAAGMRLRLGALPALAAFACSPPVRALIEPLLGRTAFAVRAVLFDKDATVNWRVPWHRDRAIAVRQRIDLPGFGPWSVKAGVTHVEPPRSFLAAMLAVRFHLDDCDCDNGPLRVIPGSHLDPELSTGDGGRPAVACVALRRAALLIRPLLLHASSRARSPRRRRVLHVEFAASALPGGLQWNERMPS